jgi:hypothetical protein
MVIIAIGMTKYRVNIDIARARPTALDIRIRYGRRITTVKSDFIAIIPENGIFNIGTGIVTI